MVYIGICKAAMKEVGVPTGPTGRLVRGLDGLLDGLVVCPAGPFTP